MRRSTACVSESPDLGSFLSRSDAIGLLEFIHGSLSCKGEEDFRKLFTKLQGIFSFDFAYAMLGHRDDKKAVIPVHAVNISFPEACLSEFLSRNFIQVDPIIRDNFREYGLQRWRGKKFKFHPEIGSLFADFGMSDGYSHGCRPLWMGQPGSMFCFSGPSVQYDRCSETMLEVVSPHLHMALSGILRHQGITGGDCQFSTRETEILNWLKRGKTSWDMSVILGISQRTVNFHVYNVMRKLGAINRSQAVAVATHMGIILPD